MPFDRLLSALLRPGPAEKPTGGFKAALCAGENHQREDRRTVVYEMDHAGGGHDGTVFDVPGCELGHRGEEVSFDAILRRYGLTDPALALLADIVRAADSCPSSPHPAGDRLRWIAHGFSALGLSDAEILERKFIVYDALYAECRRRVVRRRSDFLFMLSLAMDGIRL